MSAIPDMAPIANDPTGEISDMLTESFERQRQAYLQQPTSDYKQRKQDLLALKRMLYENREAIIEAINTDYGNRSRHESLFAEVRSNLFFRNGTEQVPLLIGLGCHDGFRAFHFRRGFRQSLTNLDTLFRSSAFLFGNGLYIALTRDFRQSLGQ